MPNHDEQTTVDVCLDVEDIGFQGASPTPVNTRPDPEAMYPGLDFILRTMHYWARSNQVHFSPKRITTFLGDVLSGKVKTDQMNGIPLDVLRPGIELAQLDFQDYCGNSYDETRWIMTGWLTDRINAKKAYIKGDASTKVNAGGHHG